MRILAVTLFAAAAALSGHAQTSQQGFVKGPVISGYGAAAPIESSLSIPEHMTLKVAFDIADAAEEGKVNRSFDTVARFLNMHAAAGIARSRIQPAIVVHGPAARDLLQSGIEGGTPTENLIEALLAEGVPIFLCGQTAAARDIAKEDLIPGVRVALSAMTAHAVLAQQGYSLNPF